MYGWLSFWHPYKEWRRLPRNQAVHGEWWTPDEPESAVRGKLIIPRFGHPPLDFEGGDELLALPFGPFDILHGRIWDLANAPATVFRSIATQGGPSYALNTPEPKQLRIGSVTINLLLIGRHLRSEAEPSGITSASLLSPYLHAWGHFDGFSRPLVPPEQADYALTFTPQRTEPVRVSDSTTVHFECLLHRSGAWFGPAQIDLRQYTVAHLQFSRLVSLLDVQQDITRLTTFINFCLRRIVDEWDIFLGYEPDRAAAPPEQQPGALIEAYSQFHSSSYNRPLLTRPDLGPELSSSLARWWSTFDRFESAIGHHLGTLGDDIPYVHVRFLSVVQGLEAYHRCLGKGGHESEKIFKKGLYSILKNVVPGDLPDPYKDAIFSKLRNLYEYTLIDRLKQIYDAQKDMVDFGFRSVDDELGQIRTMRNRLAHGESASSMDTREVLRLEDQSRLLLESAIISKITTDKKMVRSRLYEIYHPTIR